MKSAEKKRWVPVERGLPIEKDEGRWDLLRHGGDAFERMKLRGSTEELPNQALDSDRLFHALAARDALEASLYHDVVKSPSKAFGHSRRSSTRTIRKGRFSSASTIFGRSIPLGSVRPRGRSRSLAGSMRPSPSTSTQRRNSVMSTSSIARTPGSTSCSSSSASPEDEAP